MNSRETIIDLINKGYVVRNGDANEIHLRSIADELGIKIRKKGCQTCLNEAFLTIRAILLGNSTKKNTDMNIDNYELIKTYEFSRRIGKLCINNPLSGQKWHSRTFDFNTTNEVLFEIWKYNSTGYKEFFDFVFIEPKTIESGLIEAHNEFVELLDGVDVEIEPKPKKKKK